MGASVAVAARGQEQPQSRVVVALEATVERATGLSAVYYTQYYALPNMSMTHMINPDMLCVTFHLFNNNVTQAIKVGHR